MTQVEYLEIILNSSVLDYAQEGLCGFKSNHMFIPYNILNEGSVKCK